MSRRQPSEQQNEEEEEEEVPPEATQRQKLPGIPIASNKRGMLQVASKDEEEDQKIDLEKEMLKQIAELKEVKEELKQRVIDLEGENDRLGQDNEQIQEGSVRNWERLKAVTQKYNELSNKFELLKEEHETLKEEHKKLEKEHKKLLSKESVQDPHDIKISPEERKTINSKRFPKEQLEKTQKRTDQRRFFRVINMIPRYQKFTYNQIRRVWAETMSLVQEIQKRIKDGTIIIDGKEADWKAIANADDTFSQTAIDVLQRARSFITHFEDAHLHAVRDSHYKENRSLITRLEMALEKFKDTVEKKLSELEEEDEEDEEDEN